MNKIIVFLILFSFNCRAEDYCKRYRSWWSYIPVLFSVNKLENACHAGKSASEVKNPDTLFCNNFALEKGKENTEVLKACLDGFEYYAKNPEVKIPIKVDNSERPLAKKVQTLTPEFIQNFKEDIGK